MPVTRGCYRHNVLLRDCPTFVGCFYRRLVSDFAWMLIRSLCCTKEAK